MWLKRLNVKIINLVVCLNIWTEWDNTITKNGTICETKNVTTINKVVPTLMELNEHLDEMKIKVWCYRNETRTICWEYEE